MGLQSILQNSLHRRVLVIGKKHRCLFRLRIDGVDIGLNVKIQRRLA